MYLTEKLIMFYLHLSWILDKYHWNISVAARYLYIELIGMWQSDIKIDNK